MWGVIQFRKTYRENETKITEKQIKAEKAESIRFSSTILHECNLSFFLKQILKLTYINHFAIVLEQQGETNSYLTRQSPTPWRSGPTWDTWGAQSRAEDV